VAQLLFVNLAELLHQDRDLRFDALQRRLISATKAGFRRLI